MITEVGGQPPILLLDDVMSELDEARRHALASFVGEAAQTFVTTTNLGYFEEELVDRAQVGEARMKRHGRQAQLGASLQAILSAGSTERTAGERLRPG